MKRTVCLDFDGVCNLYDGWKGEDELFMPRPGLASFICQLLDAGKRVAIFSTRQPAKLEAWFRTNQPASAPFIENGEIFFPDKKPPADCYVDDRGVRFNGDFDAIMPQILGFKAHWEKMTLDEAILNAGDDETITVERDGTVSLGVAS